MTASRSTFAVSLRRSFRGVDDPSGTSSIASTTTAERQVARQAAPRAHGRAAASPTPRTVSISDGSPSFLRSAATCTSTVLDEPYQVVSQTSRRIRSPIDDDARRRATSSARRSNSFSVSCELAPVHGGAVGGHVDLDSARDEARRVRATARRSSRHRADPRDELTKAERLHDVVVGTELEADHAVDLLALGRDHDDRDVTTRDRSSRQTANPSMSGSRRSSRTRSAGAAASAAAPVATRATSKPSRRSPSSERLGDRVVVLDEQQVHHTPSSQEPPRPSSVVYRFFAKAGGAPSPRLSGGVLRWRHETHTRTHHRPGTRRRRRRWDIRSDAHHAAGLRLGGAASEHHRAGTPDACSRSRRSSPARAAAQEAAGNRSASCTHSLGPADGRLPPCPDHRARRPSIRLGARGRVRAWRRR